MKLGAMIFATDQTIAIPKLAVGLEERGFESLWIPEKTHLPASRRTPWPGGDLPEWYKRTADPFLVLAAAASVTGRLRLGTGVAMVPVRDAVICAKEVATLDWLSGGRFEFGVGYGWNAEEFATHGVNIADAGPIMAEKIQLMEALWRNDIGSFSGQFVGVEPSWSWPKPIQRPRPPIHLGARASAHAFADMARYADGWIPIEGYGEIIGQLPRLRAAFDSAGRDPAEAKVSVYAASGDPARLEQYVEAGVDRVILALPPIEETAVLHALDAHAASLAAYLH
ncbi:MAG: LLM class F420-dependent oxidoreductase [Gammaproteobacteria bacterium]|nr:LLM class F420-dependent oxidoreductase [Gammaproteobacteria bacterium]